MNDRIIPVIGYNCPLQNSYLLNFHDNLPILFYAIGPIAFTPGNSVVKYFKNDTVQAYSNLEYI
jgi:hypothetical protein